MSGIHKKPHLLTKEKLKKELRANGIELPSSEQRKDFYVRLYREHLSLLEDEHSAEEFSSDDEESPGTSPMGASKRLPPRLPPKIVISQRVKDLPFDVAALSDGDLARQLKQFGGPVGPITDSTRPLYQKRLEKLLVEEHKKGSSAKTGALLEKTPPRTKKRKEEVSAEFSDANDNQSEDEQEVETLTNETFKQEQQDQPDTKPNDAAIHDERPTKSRQSLRKRPMSETLSAKQSISQAGSIDLPVTRGNDSRQTTKIPPNSKAKNLKEDNDDKSLLSPGLKLILAILCFVVFTAALIYILMEQVPSYRIEASSG